MDMELYHKYVLSIYETGSMTQAAKKIGISQPALSSGLGNLEKRLGFRIFERKSSPLSPTPEGAVYIEFLQRQSQLVRDCQRKIADIHHSENERLVIGAPIVYAESLITRTAAEFQKCYPKCEFHIKNEAVPALVEMAKSGEVDCFISTSPELPDSFSKELVKREKIYLCVPKEWYINGRLRESADSSADGMPDYSILDGTGFICLEENQPMQREIEAFMQANNISVTSMFRVNQLSIARKLSVLGMGVSFQSDESLRGNADVDKLCVYPLPDEGFRRDVYVAYDREHYTSCACRKYIDILKTVQ